MKAALSIAFEDLRGKAGSVVVSKSHTGLFVRPRVTGKNPRTTGQQSVRGYLARAAAAYKNLTTAQVANWQAYAQTVTKVNPVSGQTYHPSANTAFCGLAAKFLQQNPTGTIPVTPPTGAFLGDTITLTATPSGGGTGVVFTASAANAANVTTELLLQPLKSRNRTPNSRGYRTKAFQVFVAGTLTKTINVTAGYYAAAYRFVNTLTGQATPLQTLPVMQITLSLQKGGRNAQTSNRMAA